jgi:hypothetical protein
LLHAERSLLEQDLRSISQDFAYIHAYWDSGKKGGQRLSPANQGGIHLPRHDYPITLPKWCGFLE